jgi:hypothetical protein
VVVRGKFDKREFCHYRCSLCNLSKLVSTFFKYTKNAKKSSVFPSGVVRWVRLGDLDINSTTDDAKPQNFSVISTYVYPDYRSSSHYHDIALLKLDQPVEFSSYVKPACLYGGRNVSEQLIATGWGKLEYFGESSSHLMKVDLNEIAHEECAKSYSNVSPRKLQYGIMDNLQVCAGDVDGKDTCPVIANHLLIIIVLCKVILFAG